MNCPFAIFFKARWRERSLAEEKLERVGPEKIFNLCQEQLQFSGKITEIKANLWI